MSSDKKELKIPRREEEAEKPPPTSLPIVGIGASAGGLEAVSELLRHLPPDTGMGFVLVQHLDPQHPSALTEILSKTTSMKVTEVSHGIKVAPNQVYVIPPNANLLIRSGVLELTPRTETRRQHMAVDCFLTSLARDLGSQAVAVILSGTASDGALGVCAIKAEGGITFAQNETARYDGMPRAAIATGHVDFVLPAEKMASELVKISRHPYVAKSEALVVKEGPKEEEDELKTIQMLLMKASGVDFSLYKEGTLKRRTQRRMALHKMRELEDYITYLQGNSGEVEALFQDILISVTGFFRDPEAFEALKSEVFPVLMENRSLDDPIRVWVPGCSTGEEVYSIAICLREFLGDMATITPFKIFGTDVSEAAINKARSGVYPENISADLSPERVRRFFMKIESGYQVIKTLRDSCVFAKQDATKDPPFSQLDFISCRNVLIYFEPILQARVIPILHYALKPTGHLMLGSSETIGQFSDLFTLVDKKNKIYSKEPVPIRMTFDFPVGSPAPEEVNAGDAEKKVSASVLDIRKEADRIVVGRYAPPGVIINKDREILQFRDETGRYLKPAPGGPTFDVLKMAREGLLLELRLAIDEALDRGVPVRKEGLRVKTNEHFTELNLEAIPLDLYHAGKPCLLINFEEVAGRRGGRPGKGGVREWPWFQSLFRRKARPLEEAGKSSGTATQAGTQDLRRELEETKHYLQTAIEEHDAKNEELKAANEEILSSNEELQSTNEELETAKEELQATNEELTTVNEELHDKNLELAEINDDLTNILNSVNIPIVMLSLDLKIRRFTPSAGKVLSLIPTDIGRPVTDIRPKISVPDLDQWILEVVENLTLKEEEVQNQEGHWYTLSLRPYRTADNKIDGAVITLIDVNTLKQSEQQARRLATFVRDSNDAITVHDFTGRILAWNRGAERLYGYEENEALRMNIRETVPEEERTGQDKFLKQLERGDTIESFETRRITKDGRVLDIWLTATVLFGPDGKPESIATTERDLTERKRMEQRLLQSARLSAVGEAVTGLTHQSRNALQRSQAAVERLERRLKDNQEALHIINELQTAQDDLHRHYENVLAYASPIRLRKENCDLREIVDAAWENLSSIQARKEARLWQKSGDCEAHCAVDRKYFQEVVRNILENSLATKTEGAVVQVSYSNRELDGKAAVRVVIHDNGPGLSPEERGRIFEAFYTTKTHGTGLGMAISKQVVEAHDGQIELGNTGAEGTEIVITLPRESKQ